MRQFDQTLPSQRPNYGAKRGYRKIDIFSVRGNYLCTTTWAKSTQEACIEYKRKNGGTVQAFYQDK